MTAAERWYRRLAWASLWFTIVVILGGSVVRASGSGDGCGETWPICDGSLLPLDGGAETIIEFTHRVFTATLGIALVGLAILTWRRVASGHPVRRWLAWAGGFFVGEVIIGALLVTFGWVDDDASIGRLVAVPIHLVNTFFLLGALTAAAHHAGRAPGEPRPVGRTTHGFILASLTIVLVVGASGALNALADTLYPAGSFGSGFAADFDGASPLLVRLRVLHPVIAVVGGLALVWLVRNPDFDPQRVATPQVNGITAIVFGQFLVGIVNVALVTPIEIQILHLLVADVLWVLVVLAGLKVTTVRAGVPKAGALMR